MSLPKISIVTPSFNQGQYLEHTIISILNQNYPNLEYIIIDGGSSDNSVDIINKYADKISYWVSEPDKGQSDALNKGLVKCTGDIFNWINSDDYLEPGALVEVAKAFDNETDIVCGYSRIFNDGDNLTLQMHRTEIFGTTEQSFVEQKINQQGMWYRLDIIKELGGINPQLHYVMDLELFWKYLALNGQNRFKTIGTTIAHFRIHEASKTGAYEDRFRQEESAILFSVLTQMGFDKEWTSNFYNSIKYSRKEWNLNFLNSGELKNQLALKYLYPAFAKGNIPFARAAFMQLLKARKLRISFQNLAMFVKLFIGDLPFRKFIKTHA